MTQQQVQKDHKIKEAILSSICQGFQKEIEKIKQEQERLLKSIQTIAYE